LELLDRIVLPGRLLQGKAFPAQKAMMIAQEIFIMLSLLGFKRR